MANTLLQAGNNVIHSFMPIFRVNPFKLIAIKNHRRPLHLQGLDLVLDGRQPGGADEEHPPLWVDLKQCLFVRQRLWTDGEMGWRRRHEYPHQPPDLIFFVLYYFKNPFPQIKCHIKNLECDFCNQTENPPFQDKSAVNKCGMNHLTSSTPCGGGDFLANTGDFIFCTGCSSKFRGGRETVFKKMLHLQNGPKLVHAF